MQYGQENKVIDHKLKLLLIVKQIQNKMPGKLLGTLLLELKLKNKLTNDIDLVRKRFSEATFQPE